MTNAGTTPASGATFTDTATPPARIVGLRALDSNGQLDINSTAWQCNDPTNAPLTCKRQPGNDIPAGGSVQVVVATATLVSASTGTVGNCAAIGNTPALNQGQPAAANLSNPSFNPNTPAGQDLSNFAQGNKTVDCTTVQIGLPPPQVTTCTPTRKPPCSGNNGDGRIYCLPGECSCSSGLVGPAGHKKQLCRDDECMTTCPANTTQPLPPPPPPPPTITVTCPEGTRMGLNGQCFFVDPGCQGPDSGQVTTGCPFGAPRRADGSCCNARDLQTGACGGTPPQTNCPGGGKRNSEGNCPTTTTSCTGGKILINNVCSCRTGTVDDGNGKCVRPDPEKNKPLHKTPRKPRPKTDSDNPAPSGSGPQFNIQIGPGFPSGGRPGGKPSRGTPKGGGNCLNNIVVEIEFSPAEASMRTRSLCGMVIAAIFVLGAPANAKEPGWCATYRNGGTNCGFNTYEQCMAAVSGVGGF